MRSRFRPRHATVVAYLALFVALGGTSYAALSITGKNVKNGSLTGADIKNGSLGTKDVKNGGLLAKDFRRGQLPRGKLGARGPQGTRGTDGTNGKNGLAGAAAASFLTGRFYRSFGLTNNFVSVVGTSTTSASESDVRTLSPATTIVARDLAVQESTSQADDSPRLYTLRVAGTDTALTCRIPGASTSCQDRVHAVSIPPGSRLSLHLGIDTSTGSGSTGTDVLFGWRATTP